MGLCSCTPLCCISHTAVLHSNKFKSKIMFDRNASPPISSTFTTPFQQPINCHLQGHLLHTGIHQSTLCRSIHSSLEVHHHQHHSSPKLSVQTMHPWRQASTINITGSARDTNFNIFTFVSTYMYSTWTSLQHHSPFY